MTRRRFGGGGGIIENLWMPAAVIVFLIIGFTVGPLKGCIPDTQQQPQTPQQAQSVVAAPVATATPPIFCKLPDGGMVAQGDRAWVKEEEDVSLRRCDNGRLVPVEPEGRAHQGEVSPP
jgi:hypothetical protein